MPVTTRVRKDWIEVECQREVKMMCTQKKAELRRKFPWEWDAGGFRFAAAAGYGVEVGHAETSRG